MALSICALLSGCGSADLLELGASDGGPVDLGIFDLGLRDAGNIDAGEADAGREPVQCGTYEMPLLVRTQREIDALEGCEMLIGALMLESDLDLRPLRSVSWVGNIRVPDRDVGLDFRGLENLEEVGTLAFSSSTRSFRGLESLRLVHLELLVSRSRSRRIELPALERVGRRLGVGTMPELETFDGLPSLESVPILELWPSTLPRLTQAEIDRFIERIEVERVRYFE